ncbi:MAG: zinc-binding dehydrogenase [Gemmatimonadales bacterium]
MRVIQMSRFGGPEVLETVEREMPVPGAGEVLVRVRAAGVNLSDTLMRQDRYAMTPPLPAVLGTEVAGDVAGVGEGVTGWRIGARVAAPLFAAGAMFGGYAEYAVIDARYVTAIPEDISYEVANALMVQGLTALLLTEQVSPAGKSVLVSAAAGGVGSQLVQLARAAGARQVIAAASSDEKLALTTSLGADAGVNYATPAWVERVRAVTGGAGPDIIYESVGGAVTMQALEALAPGGNLVIYGALNIQQFQLGVPELLGLIFKNQSLTGFATTPLLSPERVRSGLERLFGLVRQGTLRVTVGGTWPLARAADAHRALEGRGTTGKLVLVA